MQPLLYYNTPSDHEYVPSAFIHIKQRREKKKRQSEKKQKQGLRVFSWKAQLGADPDANVGGRLETITHDPLRRFTDSVWSPHVSVCSQLRQRVCSSVARRLLEIVPSTQNAIKYLQ